MSGADEEAEYDLVLAFDSDNPEFARGFEAGRLWALLDYETGVEQTVHAANAEMVIRMATAKGLPFRAENLDDNFVLVRLGTAAEP